MPAPPGSSRISRSPSGMTWKPLVRSNLPVFCGDPAGGAVQAALAALGGVGDPVEAGVHGEFQVALGGDLHDLADAAAGAAGAA